MLWAKYALVIVLKHRTVLIGWPYPTFDIASASYGNLENIIDHLKNGMCHWRAVTNDELTNFKTKAEEVENRPRKPCSDRGKPRKQGKRKHASQSYHHNSNGREESDSEEEDEDAQAISPSIVPCDAEDN